MTEPGYLTTGSNGHSESECYDCGVTEPKVFYDWSGGMESSAMLVLDIERIRAAKARVRWADTGKHFPEMYESKAQIEGILGIKIEIVSRQIDFDTFLHERGGMVKKGTNDCSRRMKRSNLARDMKLYPKPWEVNIGFNVDELDRREAWVKRNERSWLHWRFPLILKDVDRPQTRVICENAGFSIVCAMYDKMGRLDCYFCGNQRPSQAEKVVLYYPELAADWAVQELRKGHSFMPVPIIEVIAGMERGKREQAENQHIQCSCFGGDDNFTAEEFEGEAGV
jgi:hypothetical protein